MKINAMITNIEDIDNFKFQPSDIKAYNKIPFFKAPQGISIWPAIGPAISSTFSNLYGNDKRRFGKLVTLIDLDNFNSQPIHLIAVYVPEKHEYDFMNNRYDAEVLKLGSLWLVEFHLTSLTKSKYSISTVTPENLVNYDTKGQYFIEGIVDTDDFNETDKRNVFVNEDVLKSYVQLPDDGATMSAPSQYTEEFEFNDGYRGDVSYSKILFSGVSHMSGHHRLNWFESMIATRFHSEQKAKRFCKKLSKKYPAMPNGAIIHYRVLSMVESRFETNIHDEYLSSKDLMIGLAILMNENRYYLSNNLQPNGYKFGSRLTNFENGSSIVVDSRAKMSALIHQFMNSNQMVSPKSQNNHVIGQAFTEEFINALN